MTCESTAGPWAGGSINTPPCHCNRPSDHEGVHSCGCGASWTSEEAAI